MYSSKVFIVLMFTILTIAGPVIRSEPERACAIKKKSYNSFQISDGVAGNALAEVNAEFPVDMNNLDGVSASDLEIIANARSVANDAQQAFEDALANATGPAAKALQNGSNKNKVLLLQTFILELSVQLDQGSRNALDGSNHLKAIEASLDKAVATDKAHAGEVSWGVFFDG